MEVNMRGHVCCDSRVDDGFEHGETDGLSNHKDMLRDPMRDEIHEYSSSILDNVRGRINII